MKILLIGYGKINKLLHDKYHDNVIGVVCKENKKIDETPNVIIDFSHPSFLEKTIFYAKLYNAAVIIGTTGYDIGKTAKIKELSQFVPIIKSENFSYGIYMIKKLLSENKEALKNYKKEIFETHHINKKDRPSGTAIALYNILEDSTIISKRDSDTVGIHEIIMENENEIITITHKAKKRECFIEEIEKIASWIIHQKSGYYTYEDFLNVRN